VQALLRVRRREADTTSYVADYLTRSVRGASGFVLADYSGLIASCVALKCRVWPILWAGKRVH
jgi:hypothetical protein